MSKESSAGQECVCGLTVAFPEYHMFHCKGGIVEAPKKRKRKRKKS